MCDSSGDPSPEECEETSSATRIFFLPSWPSHVKPRDDLSPPILGALAFAGFFIVAVLSGLFWAVESLLTGSIAAPLRPGPAMGLAALALMTWVVIRWLRRTKWRSLSTLKHADPLSARFICVDLPPSERPGALLPDVPFEPAVFLAFMAVAPSGKSLMLGMLALSVPLVGQFTDWYNGYGPVGIFAAMFAGLAAGELIWPTYFRIVPGRMDAMRYSFLSDRPVSVKKTALRDVRIIYDHSKYTLHLHTAEWTDYWIMLVPRRRQFIHALFLAAASTHQPPPLPDDALLG